MKKKVNIIIENSIFSEDNLIELNHFLTICTMAQNENELKNEFRILEEFGSFKHLEEKGLDTDLVITIFGYRKNSLEMNGNGFYL
jgi:hypothetical protein